MSGSATTFYDEHPFDWTEAYTPHELQVTLAPPLKYFINDLSREALILDIGCGTGRVVSCLTARGLQCMGLDVSRVSVQRMTQRTGKPGIVASSLQLPFANESIDRVIADGMIHHTTSPFDSFAESCRVLKPGGLLYAAVYKPTGRYKKLYRFPGSIIRGLVVSRAGRTLVHTIVLPLYYLVHFLKSRGKTSWYGATNLFYDYFVTPIVRFLSCDDLQAWSQRCGVDIVGYHSNPGLNVHSFLIRKPMVRNSTK
jgi:ubiquinone/menaquinone biosynthesis C-methylase UbiE